MFALQKAFLIWKSVSVKKRMKDKAFAAASAAKTFIKGAAELGIPLDEHIAFCIQALREHADALGLRGSL